MAKKTAYSRSGAQRNKTRQKSFELVRPVSDEKALDSVKSGETEERAEEEVVETASSETTFVEEEEEEEHTIKEEDGEEVKETVEVVKEVKARPEKGANARVGGKAAATAVVSVPAPSSGSAAPRSAAARLAARRQAGQKSQRSSANLITAEHYSYVRKDLIFILILAIIMFGTIIALHFILGG